LIKVSCWTQEIDLTEMFKAQRFYYVGWTDRYVIMSLGLNQIDYA